ncbi:MAG: flavodoxin [Dorea sp.]
MGRTNDKLKPSCPGATLLKGKLLNGEVSEDTMKRWLKDLNL